MKHNPCKRLAILAFSSCFVAALTVPSSARDLVLPAGTILQCVLNEPNFSSATAEVGDPVVCHLRQVSEFGEQVLPRGSYLVGHLESAKEPGHFFGKGHLKLQFDRMGLPMGDFPLNAKLIAVHGYKVDREGKIDGKGHAKRDIAEWMLPPLWPWKVIMLPARGPRPKLKGESTLSLRLMDDVQIPVQTQGPQTGFFRRQSYGSLTPGLHQPAVRDLPANRRQDRECGQTFGPEWHFFGQPQCGSFFDSQPDVAEPKIRTVPPPDLGEAPGALYAGYVPKTTERLKPVIPEGDPIFVMKTGTAFAVDSYSYQKGHITYALAGGESGVIDTNKIDWSATAKVNDARGLRITLRTNQSSW